MTNALPGDWGWTGPAAELRWDYVQDPARHNYSLAYVRSRQLGRSHEEAVQEAQLQVYRKVRSKNPEPENDHNRTWAITQLASTLPALQAAAASEGDPLPVVIHEAASTPVPTGVSDRRMAMRWGLPALGVLGGLYGMSALVQPREDVRQESYSGTAEGSR
jgi:hypothetical protein